MRGRAARSSSNASTRPACYETTPFTRERHPARSELGASGCNRRFYACTWCLQRVGWRSSRSGCAGTPRELGRRTGSGVSLDQKRARVFGVLYLVTFVTSILALVLY